MRIRTQCRPCGYPYKTELAASTDSLVCPNCSAERPLEGEPADGERLQNCTLCGSEHLYCQRDVNRGAGCALVALGAAFVPWTYGLSLISLGLVDLWLYYRLPMSVVCYKCDTVFRDARPTERQAEFDLLKHDVLKYGKSWQELDADGNNPHHH